MNQHNGHVDEGPGAVVSPPLLFLVILLAGLLLHLLFPLKYFNSLQVQLGVGLPIIAAGVGLIGWAARTLIKAGTDPRPHSPVRSVVVNGPFKSSRNPIYLGFIITLFGIAIAAGSVWLILLEPVTFAVLSLQVKREERYLEAKFGEEYREYMARVRRWL